MTKCAWPGCHTEYAGKHNGKPLCDLHVEKVLSENSGVAERAAAKLGIPACKKADGRIPSFDERIGVVCAVPGCGHPVSVLAQKDGREVPLCTAHYNRVDLADMDAAVEVPVEEEDAQPFDWEAFEASMDEGEFDL